MEFNIKDIVKLMNGHLLYWSNKNIIKCFSAFDDYPKSNSLYFVTEPINDENRYISWLKKHCVEGVVIENSNKIDLKKWQKDNIGIITVERIWDSLDVIGKYYRKMFNIPIVEVIGSSGKTTTKDMIASILSEELNTYKTYKNTNGPKGVLYNLFNVTDEHEAAVFEVGMHTFGDMDFSSSNIKADIGVVTCIHRAHMTHLKSIENIIKAKSEIIPHISKDGSLIINGDDQNTGNMPLKNFKGTLYRYGLSKNNDLYAENIYYKDNKTFFTVKSKDTIFKCWINFFGDYNVTNALAAIAVALKLNVSKVSIKEGLKKYKPFDSRQQRIEGINHSTIIDDNFNANPDSTMALLKELKTIAKEKSLVLFLGDFENPDESSDYARNVHYQVGREISNLNFEYLIAVGKWAKEYIRACQNNGVDNNKLYYFRSTDEINININNIDKDTFMVFKAQVMYVDFKIIIEKLKKKIQ